MLNVEGQFYSLLASCAVNYTGCDRVPKDIFDDSIMANLANACNKRGVCYACVSLFFCQISVNKQE